MPSRRRSPLIVAQFVRYGAAGAAGTLVQYVTLVALVELAGAGSVAASTIGAVIGALVNYILNYRYTFRSVRPHADTAWKYVTVSAAGIGLNAAIIAAATALGMHYVVAQLIATAAVLMTAFAVNRQWTF